ncbi:MAG: 4Fe-4S dicluster domain-containing protein [Georgfuchsia sp.]
MVDKIYQDLRSKINTYALGFPATASGVEIELLKRLFTRDEAEVGVNLGMMPEPLEAIAARMKRDPDELLAVLSSMIRKGTVFNSLSAEGETCFHAAPFMHGFAENSAGNMDPELANLFERFQEEGYLDHFGKLPTDAFLRFTPVNEAVSSDLTVAAYNQIEPLLRSKKTIAAIPCYCRDKGKALGDKIDLPTSNVCFVFDWLADYSVERGQAKYLTIDEALEIQQGCEDAGLVNMPSNLKSPHVMCHCDGKYCTIFRAIKRLPKPVDAVTSDFYTEVKKDDCISCDACIDICPMEAITGNGEGTVDINLDRCIGCGVCIPTCAVGALNLQEKPEELKKRKPISPREFVAEISKSRGFETTPIILDSHQTV